MGWSAGLVSGGNILTTQLDGLGNGVRSAVSVTFYNDTTKPQYALLKFTTPGFPVAPTDSNPALKINMISAANGTDWADGSDTVDPGLDTARGAIPVLQTQNAQAKEYYPIMLLPGPHRFLITNETGQDLRATGNVIEIFTWEA